MSIAIIDYNMGNVRSVANAFEAIGCEVKITNQPVDIEKATHIVLPGVGAFGEGMKNLKGLGLMDILSDQIVKKGKPFLGICLGMQLLAEKGFEFGECQGLGWIGGDVIQLNSGHFPLPHVGWNNLENVFSCAILDRLSKGSDFYFVHSFHFRTKASENTKATCLYGEEFAAVVNHKNMFGVQFHPEKSQKAGKVLLENFAKLT